MTKRKLTYALALLILALLMGCSNKPYPCPASEQSVKFDNHTTAGHREVSTTLQRDITPEQKAHWENRTNGLYPKNNWFLVCDGSTKIIAVVNQTGDQPVYVFGGDGSGYGKYMTIQAAKQKAESLAMNEGWSSSHYGENPLSCP